MPFQSLNVLVAVVGILVLSASTQVFAETVTVPRKSAQILNVSLDSERTLSGAILNLHGHGVEGRKVTLWLGKKKGRTWDDGSPRAILPLQRPQWTLCPGNSRRPETRSTVDVLVSAKKLRSKCRSFHGR